MKKLLITVCLSGLLSVPSVVLGAEMGGASLYGSFRTGLTFGSGEASVSDIGSRWGFKGSHEVAEGLTASYKYESKFNTTNAKSSGGAGHKHAAVDAIADVDEVLEVITNEVTAVRADFDHDDDGGTTPAHHQYSCTRGNPLQIMRDDMEMITGYSVIGEDDSFETELGATNVACGNIVSHTDAGSDAEAAINANGGLGGRLSYISLSGGFGSITLGQIWSASAIHYGFKVDPSYAYGAFGGASYRTGNTVSYSSSAGDVSFQIDKSTGDKAALELGASATLGPVGVGLGYKSGDDDSGFTGLAVSAGAAGVNLTIGLGSTKPADGGMKTKTNILNVGGSLGDTGLSYALQVANSDQLGGKGDQNLIVVTNSLGSGASLIFEHLSQGEEGKDSKSMLALKVDF